MINPFQEINWKPDKNELRKFGKALIIGGAIIALLAWTGSLISSSLKDKGVYISGLFAIVSLLGALVMLCPKYFKWLYLIWYFIAACIGTVISNLLLAGFYYLVFSPISLVMRLVGHNPLKLKRAPEGSQWIDHKQPGDPGQYYRQS